MNEADVWRDAVVEFKKIFVETYAEELKDDDAYELARNLLNIYRIVYRQPPDGRWV